MKVKEISRKEIIDLIVNSLQPLEYVYALWQGGAAAFGRVDEWSDIDIVVDVQDDKIDDVFKILENTLIKLSPIEQVYEVPQPTWHGFYQRFYKLQRASRFLVIDFAAAKHSNPNKFLEREIHGDLIVHFDKKGLTAPKPVNKDEFAKKLRERLNEIRQRFNMFQFLIEKELNRENYMEAISFYFGFTVNLLVEALRIKYKPFHHNFNTRYIHYDLPEDVVKKLEELYFIKDEKELRYKHIKASNWIKDTLLELEGIDIRKIL